MSGDPCSYLLSVCVHGRRPAAEPSQNLRRGNRLYRLVSTVFPRQSVPFLGLRECDRSRYMETWSISGKIGFLPSIPLAKDRKRVRRDPKDTLTYQSLVVTRSNPIRFCGTKMRGSHYKTLTPPSLPKQLQLEPIAQGIPPPTIVRCAVQHKATKTNDDMWANEMMRCTLEGANTETIIHWR
jgi:hypothetical protein